MGEECNKQDGKLHGAEQEGEGYARGAALWAHHAGDHCTLTTVAQL